MADSTAASAAATAGRSVQCPIVNVHRGGGLQHVWYAFDANKTRPALHHATMAVPADKVNQLSINPLKGKKGAYKGGAAFGLVEAQLHLSETGECQLHTGHALHLPGVNGQPVAVKFSPPTDVKCAPSGPGTADQLQARSASSGAESAAA